MEGFRDLPIRTKLLVMGLVASGSALLLACVAFVAYDQFSFRRQIFRKLATQAEIIGSNAAPAILFRDPKAATQTLAALRAEPHVVSASITTAGGEFFATYRRQPQAVPPDPLKLTDTRRAEALTGADVVLSHRIEVDGRDVGTVTIRSDLGEIDERVGRILLLGAGVFALSLLVALLVSAPLARTLSRPMLLLAATTRRISEEKDYAVRAPEAGRDEVGLLVRSVNQMLGEIQARDEQLQAARTELQQRNEALEQRTSELQREVAERRAAERELEVRAQELARSNADLEQFAYVASHDLQEPLRMVAAYVQLLEEEHGTRLDDGAREYLRFALDGTFRMHALIQDLLAYSRVGTRGERFQPVDCDALLRDVLVDLRAPCDESRCMVEHDPLPTVIGDPPQLRQLFQNLLSNAIKFRGAQPPRIHVTATPEESSWRFVFADNGIGLDPRHGEKIFVIFQRLHSREKYPGTGIGLAICKKIVDRHGGRIWVESQPGQGSRFCFTLSLTPAGSSGGGGSPGLDVEPRTPRAASA